MIIFEDQGWNEYKAYTDDGSQTGTILVVKPMGLIERAWIKVEITYNPRKVKKLLKQYEEER